jgi:hypothetical protein
MADEPNQPTKGSQTNTDEAARDQSDAARHSDVQNQAGQQGWHADEQEHKRHEKRYWRFQYTTSSITLLFSFGAAVGAFTGSYIAYQAFIASTHAVSEAKRQADAAEAQIAIARDTAERQLRAYMSPMGSAFFEFDPNHPEKEFFALIVFKNSGQTPAYDFTAKGGATVAEFPLKEKLSLRDQPSGPGAIGPGNEYRLRVGIEGVPKDYWMAVQAGQAAIYVNGIYSYRDAFKIERTGEFRLYYGGKHGLTKDYNLTFDLEGNRAD